MRLKRLLTLGVFVSCPTVLLMHCSPTDPGPVQLATSCELDKLNASSGEVTLKAYIDTANELLTRASTLEQRLLGACNAIDKDVGLPAGSDVKAACNAVATKIKAAKNLPIPLDAGPEAGTPPIWVQIQWDGTACSSNTTAEVECLKQCSGGAACDPLTACPVAKLTGTCSGQCTGKCTHTGPSIDCTGDCAGACALPEAGVACAAECVGTCTAASWTGRCSTACNSGFLGSCGGTCTGTCNDNPVGMQPAEAGTDAGGDADPDSGTDGGVDEAGTEAGGPADAGAPIAPMGADGNCNGLCKGQCSSKASGRCASRCTGDFAAGPCTGVGAKCIGTCNAPTGGCASTCSGICRAASAATAGVCTGDCAGGCSVPLTAPSCSALTCEANTECKNVCKVRGALAATCAPMLGVAIRLVGDYPLYDAVQRHMGELAAVLNEVNLLNEASLAISGRTIQDFAAVGASRDVARQCVLAGGETAEKARAKLATLAGASGVLVGKPL